MKLHHVFLLLASLCACMQRPHNAPPRDRYVIPDQYIVSLRANLSSAALQTHVRAVSRFHAHRTSSSTSSSGTVGVQRTYDYAGVFRGYVGSFDAHTLQWLAGHPDVVDIEHDTVVSLHRAGGNASAYTTQDCATWGLAALSHDAALDAAASPLNGHTYTYDSRAGGGQVAYLLDTGVDVAHPEFEGRAVLGHNSLAPDVPDGDREGHGTHVAGTIIARTWGVAKKGSLISVKVMDDGTGSMSTVLDGFTWAIQNITTTPGRLATSAINMSLGGFRSRTLDRVVSHAYSLGIPTIASAGNNAIDVAYVSPAGGPGALSVGASNSRSQMWVWSNYGPSLDVLAPGVDIYSIALRDTASGERSPKSFTALSGTSMSAPHVTGLALYLRSIDPSLDTAEKLKQRIIEISRKGVLDRVSWGTPNRMVFNGLGLGNSSAVNGTRLFYRQRSPPGYRATSLGG